MDRTASGWINGLIGVRDLQRIAAGHARGGDAVRSGLPDRRARGDRRRAGAGLLLVFREKRPARGDMVSLVDRRAGRRGRLSPADGAGAAACHLGALDRLHRPAAAGDGDFRRAARRRAAEAGILAVLGAGQRAGGGLCPDAGADGLAHRRCADAGRHHRLRAGLCGGRQAVPQARRLAGDLLGAGAVAAGHGRAADRSPCRRRFPASACRPGSASPMSRCSAC